MELTLTAWNMGFYECKKENGIVEKWVVPFTENRNTENIKAIIKSHSSDVVILNEFGRKSNRPQIDTPICGVDIIKSLENDGYICIFADNWYRSILIAVDSKKELQIKSHTKYYHSNLIESCLSVVIEVINKTGKVTTINLMGVCVPPRSENGSKDERINSFWNRMIQFARENSIKEDEAVIIAGDFNAFLADDSDVEKSSFFSERLAEMAEILIDSWRDKKKILYSTYNCISSKKDAWTYYTSNKNSGRRLDYIFASKNLMQNAIVEHFHDERTEGYSDHSAIHIKFEI